MTRPHAWVCVALVLGAVGCSSILGNPNRTLLPSAAPPSEQLVQEDPCRYGDAARCIAECESKDPELCNAAGVLAEFGVGMAPDALRAAKMYQRACGVGFAPGCNNLGWLYALGKGVTRDPPVALALFTRAYDASRFACREGDMSACVLAGEMLFEGRGTQPDERMALALFELACSSGYSRGCTWVSRLR